MYKLMLSLIILVTNVWVVSTDKVPDCPTCVMPCRESNLNRQSLTKLYFNYIDSYTITTILDGYEGSFKITISQNTTDYLVYSAEISVVHWYFSVYCRILCEIPVITTVIDDNSQLKVQFPSFRFFFVHLQSPADSIDSLFYIKVGILQNELHKTIKQLSLTSRDLLNTSNELSITQNELLSTKSELSDTRSKVDRNTEVITSTRNELSIVKSELSSTNELLMNTSNDLSSTQSELNFINIKFDNTNNKLKNSKNELSITKSKLLNIQNELLELRNEIFLMNETIQSMKQTTRICGNSDLTSIVANAVTLGNGWICNPSDTNVMVDTDGGSYCYIASGNYVYFDFREIFILTVIRFGLWDGDSRTYTYNLEISTNRVDWTSLAAGVEGTSTEEYILEEATRVRYIRMEGTSTSNNYLILYSMSVDCVDTPV